MNRQCAKSQGWRHIAALIHRTAHTSIPANWGKHRRYAAKSRLLTRALPTHAQWLKQSDQIIVVKLMHQGQQLPELPRRKALPREPREIVTGQVSDDPALVLAKWHLTGKQQLKQFRVHLASAVRHQNFQGACRHTGRASEQTTEKTWASAYSVPTQPLKGLSSAGGADGRNVAVPPRFPDTLPVDRRATANVRRSVLRTGTDDSALTKRLRIKSHAPP